MLVTLGIPILHFTLSIILISCSPSWLLTCVTTPAFFVCLFLSTISDTVALEDGLDFIIRRLVFLYIALYFYRVERRV
ncbi:hypothetical protein BDV38DRAFT_185521 [Aspergillus pseudotamarii]|uniref:Uncharacterized protein n=1 Tax=Aspergillus pseudotamarii TaxID=132259 RepID=A0A5N6SF90_ASPPS|nr:uncharacterized protein BDV38DRAFT_185521 [Aspergillus pseudotamarii]KAE8133378.1 hypothetical protein BDV38DRAFT_185521 [Aspergillus pseudotamarii]